MGEFYGFFTVQRASVTFGIYGDDGHELSANSAPGGYFTYNANGQYFATDITDVVFVVIFTD